MKFQNKQISASGDVSKYANEGFTLIELLVVISIIGILAAISLVSFTTSQRQARDTQRKSDIKQYSTSLESYANQNNGLYPSHTAIITLTQGNNILCTDLSLTNCPGDPKTSDASFGYKYVSDGTGSSSITATKHVLWGKLENSSNYWVVCSNGKAGTKAQTGWSDPTAGTCPI